MNYSPIEQRLFDAVIEITSKLFLLHPEEQEAVARALENPGLSSQLCDRETLKGFANVIRNHKEED